MIKKGNNITAHELALEICAREGFKYEDAHTFAKDLLCRRVDGQALAAQEKRNNDPEYIKHQKQLHQNKEQLLPSNNHCCNLFPGQLYDFG